MPNTQISLDWDRYTYARGNPINYRDPTGHCVEGSEDYDDCMEWAAKIEGEYKNVNVITCTGNDTKPDCKGWTAIEMKILYDVLSKFNFDQASAIMMFMRQSGVRFGDAGVVTYRSNESRYLVSLFDQAWYTNPKADTFSTEIGQLFFKTIFNFAGVMAHELTRIAITEGTSSFEQWNSLNGGTWRADKNFFYGAAYNDAIWQNMTDLEEQQEMYVVVNAASLYDPGWVSTLWLLDILGMR